MPAAGESLTVMVGGATYNNVVADSDGNWSLDTAKTSDAGTLDLGIDGTYQVTATTTDAAGNSTEDNNSDELVIVTTAPAIPSIDADVTTAVFDVLYTTDVAPVITATGAALLTGERLTVQLNGFTYTLGAADTTNGQCSNNAETATPTPL